MCGVDADVDEDTDDDDDDDDGDDAWIMNQAYTKHRERAEARGITKKNTETQHTQTWCKNPRRERKHRKMHEMQKVVSSQ